MKDNTDKSRFELEENGLVTFADYQLDGDRLYIKHVEAPEQARGTGSAGRLMQQVAEHAKANSYRIVPICGYAAVWLKRSAEYKSLIAG